MDTEVQDVSMAVEGVEMSDVDYSSIIKESTGSENITLPEPFESFLHTQGADCCELPAKKRKRSKLVCFHLICAGTYLGLVVNKKEKELLQHTGLNHMKVKESIVIFILICSCFTVIIYIYR